METHNIISTPEITGNIGSCTTQMIKVPSEYGFFRAEGIQIVTNSCTGEVTQHPYEAMSGWSGGAILVVLFLVVGLLFSK